MELKQALGNTWYLEDWQLIPLYRTDETHCILLDTGLYSQRREIEDALAAAHLTPIGILGAMPTMTTPPPPLFPAALPVQGGPVPGEAGAVLQPGKS